MATGKTKISRELSNALGFDLADTDDMIAEAAGMSINEIFEKYGEEHFRRLEREAVKKAAALESTVISTGGGTVLCAENMTELRKNGIIFNLAPNFSVIAERIEKAAKTRPLLQGQSIDDIYKRFCDRSKYYDNCDYKVNVTNDRTPAENSLRILEIYRSINGI